MKMCDQFIILHQGKVIKQGDKSELEGLFEEITTFGVKSGEEEASRENSEVIFQSDLKVIIHKLLF